MEVFDATGTGPFHESGFPPLSSSSTTPPVFHESEFPPLSSSSTTPPADPVDIKGVLQLMKQADEAYTAKMKQADEAYTAKFSLLSDQIGDLRILSRAWSEREVLICGGEILKWSVKKHSTPTGEGLHMYGSDIQHLVFAGAASMGMSNRIEEYKNMSRLCILARNDAAHFSSLKELECSVKLSTSAIKIFPILLELYPMQCRIVCNYGNFKKFLPDCFVD